MDSHLKFSVMVAVALTSVVPSLSFGDDIYNIRWDGTKLVYDKIIGGVSTQNLPLTGDFNYKHTDKPTKKQCNYRFWR